MPSNRFFEAVAAWVRYLNRAGAVFAGAIVFAMMAITIPDASRRMLFDSPIAGVVELNETFMVLAIFPAIAFTQQVRGHIRVDLAVRHLSPKQATFLELFVHIIGLAFFSLLLIQTFRDAQRAFTIKEFVWAAGIFFPIWWAKIFIPLGCLMMCIQLVVDAARCIGRIGYPSEQPGSVSVKT